MSGPNALQGQVAVVTGASRGIGRAIALELAACGARITVGYHTNSQAAESVVAEIRETGGEAIAIGADVGDEEQVTAMFRAVTSQLGPPEILVCNAGITRDNLLGAMHVAEWDDVLRVNLRGHFLCIRAAIPAMMSRRSGAIVALSSIAATVGGRGHANYAASKGATEAMVRSLAVELAPRSIRVNAVAPGIIATDMTNRIRAYNEQGILRMIPMRRFGKPEDVAKVVRFLVSADASYLTGAVVPVTGGFGLSGGGN